MKEIDALQAVSGKARVTARGADGGVHASGRVIAYCDVPSVVIEREDGTRFSWRADLTEVAEELPVASWRITIDVGPHALVEQRAELLDAVQGAVNYWYSGAEVTMEEVPDGAR